MDNPYISSAPNMFDAKRKDAMAQMLMQQGLAHDGGTQFAGGYAIRKSPLEGLAKALMVYKGQQLANESTEDQKQMQQQGMQDVSRFVEALRGTPARPAYELAPDMQGPTAPEQSAIPGDVNRAMAIALQSQNPMLQQAGGALLQSNVAASMPKAPKWERVELPAGDGSKRVGFVDMNSANPLQTFREGGKDPAKMEVSGGNVYNPYQVQPGQQFTPPANPAQDLLLPGPDGQLIPNDPLIKAKQSIAKSGAGNTSIKVENKLGEGVAAQVGPMAKESLEKAVSAQSTLSTIGSIREAMSKGNVILGPTAGARQGALRVLDLINAAPKDTPEALANTRQVEQGLAMIELEAAQIMKGQGSVTESERGIIKRAAAGEIGNLSPAELETALKAIERNSKSRLASHEQTVKRLRSNQSTAPVADFYAAPPAPAAAGGWSIKPVP